jgi:hypothetical protein
MNRFSKRSLPFVLFWLNFFTNIEYIFSSLIFRTRATCSINLTLLHLILLICNVQLKVRSSSLWSSLYFVSHSVPNILLSILFSHNVYRPYFTLMAKVKKGKLSLCLVILALYHEDVCEVGLPLPGMKPRLLTVSYSHMDRISWCEYRQEKLFMMLLCQFFKFVRGSEGIAPQSWQ